MDFFLTPPTTEFNLGPIRMTTTSMKKDYKLFKSTGCQSITNLVVRGVDYWAKIYLLEVFKIKCYQY